MLRPNDQVFESISDINVTPFVDVLLVLLVIFMITAPLFTKTIDIQLPQENVRSADLKDARKFIVTINKNGNYYIKDKKYSLKKLKAIASTWGEKNRDKVAFIRADKSVDYGKVTALMAILKNLGIQQLGLLVENKNN
ncbi:MAG: protein TolR [Deltaproteobacteria bacterium]|nr:protein TolR [Deltaproteobacteria bacterium]MBT4527498.1 protein TolR [Deltaproteobacteria bacterium]